jgi:hypothetical protein
MLAFKALLIACLTTSFSLSCVIPKCETDTTTDTTAQASGATKKADVPSKFTIVLGSATGADVEKIPAHAVEPVKEPTVKPGTYREPNFNFTIEESCQDSQKLQIERALRELHRLSTDALDTLLQASKTDLNKLYWGDAKRSDISTPVGVFYQLLHGSKDGVVISCDDKENKCKADKVTLEGGYVDKEKGTIRLCPDDFAG